MQSKHIPVLSSKIISYISERYKDPISMLDCTLGCGGHAFSIIQNIKVNELYGLDQDKNAIEEAKKTLSNCLPNCHSIVNSEFSEECKRLAKINKKFDLIIMDLGMSSLQLDDPNRGFSFKFKSSPLDMRMNINQKIDARHILNNLSSKDLIKIFIDYEVPNPRKIVSRIIEYRNKKLINTVGDLLDAISFITMRNKRSLPSPTLLFQALRIHVNKELSKLTCALEIIPQIMNEGASLIVISFHSLEDRIVKHFIKDCPNITAINKKPIVADHSEFKLNNRSRCAKMRIAIKTNENKEKIAFN